MAKDPAFLFYSSDFLTGTMLLTDDQVGKYIRLLCYQHQKGRLTEKDMLSICKAYDEDVLSKFTKDKEGRYYNERLEKEMVKRQLYTESRRNNAKHPKKNGAYAPHMDNHMENENIDSNKESIIKEREAFKKFEDWITKNAANVSKMKEPFTNDQYKEVKEKYKGEFVKDVLKAMHNWKDLTKKNVSAYLTFLNWAKKREGESQTIIKNITEANSLPSRLKKIGL